MRRTVPPDSLSNRFQEVDPVRRALLEKEKNQVMDGLQRKKAVRHIMLLAYAEGINQGDRRASITPLWCSTPAS